MYDGILGNVYVLYACSLYFNISCPYCVYMRLMLQHFFFFRNNAALSTNCITTQAQRNFNESARFSERGESSS